MPRMTASRAKASKVPPVAVVVSRYNRSVTDRLLAGALEAYADAGGDPSDVSVVDAPGAFELPVLAQAACERRRVRGVVALGCVIRGETSHDRHIASAVAQGLTEVSLRSGIPVAFGLLTVENAEQARARAGGDKGNKGAEAMSALIQTMHSIRALKEPGDDGPLDAAPIERPDKAVPTDAVTHG